MTMGDRIVLMNEGAIQQIGTPMEVYDSPANIFVAGFIGSPAMNLIRCRMFEESSKLFIDTGDFKLPLPEEFSDKIRAAGDSEFSFGVRPEDIRERRLEPQTSFDGIIKAQVNVIETLGREVFLDLSTGNNSLTAIVDTETTAKFHQNIELEVNMMKIHLFRVESGEAII